MTAPRSTPGTTPPLPNDCYTSPLAQRNASRHMLALWSPRHKFSTWRRVWLAAAQAQHEAGLPVSADQVAAIRARLDISDAEIARAGQLEAELRHDVMAHVHALGEAAPAARPILHLGLTSEDVGSNADVLILRAALDLIAAKLGRTIDALATLARRWRDLPTLGLTHFQPAQPTTVGRRAAQWGYDLCLCLERIETTRVGLRLRGLRGATGTQASFLELCAGNAAKVEAIEQRFIEHLDAGDRPGQVGGGTAVHTLTPQTYPRVVDAFILSDLAGAAAAIHKVCNDIRLLCGRKEMDEPFGAAQIGSSAMPYKQNPMRCERATGLCRFVMSLAQNALDTAATQWLERTLDDSANRRLSLPEAFLALDGALDLLHSVGSGLVIHEATVRANLDAELPFMATENLMMAAVKLGRDRQEVHEAIRRHARQAGSRVKHEGEPNDLADRLRAEPLLRGVDVAAALDAGAYIGRAAEQVDRFIESVEGIRRRLRPAWESLDSSEPGV